MAMAAASGLLASTSAGILRDEPGGEELRRRIVRIEDEGGATRGSQRHISKKLSRKSSQRDGELQRVQQQDASGAERCGKSRSGDGALGSMAQEALEQYFQTLNGHRPEELYDLVIGEVEKPLFKAVLEYTGGNQSLAASILGINRGTLRKKLRRHGLLG
jgi:Fis family transcriptional regulator, factor for inversion stimulation protein